jgi:hypothetical protein
VIGTIKRHGGKREGALIVIGGDRTLLLLSGRRDPYYVAEAATTNRGYKLWRCGLEDTARFPSLACNGDRQ